MSKDTEIAHLAFADNLIALVNGDIETERHLKANLGRFNKFTGLEANIR